MFQIITKTFKMEYFKAKMQQKIYALLNACYVTFFHIVYIFKEILINRQFFNDMILGGGAPLGSPLGRPWVAKNIILPSKLCMYK